MGGGNIACSRLRLMMDRAWHLPKFVHLVITKMKFVSQKKMDLAQIVQHGYRRRRRRRRSRRRRSSRRRGRPGNQLAPPAATQPAPQPATQPATQTKPPLQNLERPPNPTAVAAPPLQNQTYTTKQPDQSSVPCCFQCS